MTAQPDADELAVRSRLHKLLAAPAPAPDDDPDPDDWWDQLYDDQQDDRDPEDEEPEQPPEPPASPDRARTRPAYRTSRPSPRQSLLDAWDGTSPRLRWLIYHGTAAGFGWGLGLVTWSTHVTAWIAADRYTDPQSIVCYLLGLAAVAGYRRSRGWWWPVAWMAAVPVSSIITGVLLYAPNP